MRRKKIIMKRLSLLAGLSALATVGVAFASFVVGKGTVTIDNSNKSISNSISYDPSEIEVLGNINAVVSIEGASGFGFNGFYNVPSESFAIYPISSSESDEMFKLNGTITHDPNKIVTPLDADDYKIDVTVKISLELSSEAPSGTKTLKELDDSFVDSDERTFSLDFVPSMEEGDPGHYEYTATLYEDYEDLSTGFMFNVTPDNVEDFATTLEYTTVVCTITAAEFVDAA